jgi:hypothetical protein
MADIQTLVNLIPDAQDGNIIHTEYHNTMKTALLAIAAKLSGPSGPSVTLTVAPDFVAIAGGAKPWNLGIGVASDSGPPSTDGFVSLNLPDGALIQSMTVMGARTSTTSVGFVNLLVVPIAGSASGATGITTLIQIDLSTGGNPFTLSGTPNATVSGLTASALSSMRTVQNSQFKYAIEAKLSTVGTEPGSVLIYALQIAYAVS